VHYIFRPLWSSSGASNISVENLCTSVNEYNSKINTVNCKKPKGAPPLCFLCIGQHPANYKGCLVYSDLASARNRNNSQYERRNKARITLDTHQPQINNNVQTNTVSYAQAVAGLSAETTNKNNQNHNCTDVTTQLTTFLNEFKNMFNQLLHQNSMILSKLTTVINKLTQ
jgi:hypothetical protein